MSIHFDCFVYYFIFFSIQIRYLKIIIFLSISTVYSVHCTHKYSISNFVGLLSNMFFVGFSYPCFLLSNEKVYNPKRINIKKQRKNFMEHENPTRKIRRKSFAFGWCATQSIDLFTPKKKNFFWISSDFLFYLLFSFVGIFWERTPYKLKDHICFCVNALDSVYIQMQI